MVKIDAKELWEWFVTTEEGFEPPQRRRPLSGDLYPVPTCYDRHDLRRRVRGEDENG